MANSTGKSFAQQLAERTQPYFEEVVVRSIDSAKQILESYFSEVAVDRNRDVDEVNKKIEEYQSDFKKINDKVSHLILSESAWHSDVVKRLSDKKSESKESSAKVSEEVVERAVISKVGEENRSFEAGKISVIQIVSDIRGRLDKVQEDNREDTQEVLDNFIKPVKEYGKATTNAVNSISKEIASIKKKLPKNFLEKILKGVGLLFIGLAFKDKIMEAVRSALEPIKEMISNALFPGFKEKQEEKQTQELYQDKWDTSSKLESSEMAELEKQVLAVPKTAVSDVLKLHEEGEPKRDQFESRRDFKSAQKRWKTQKEMLEGLQEDWYRYHPEELPYDIPESATRGDWWALTTPSASLLHRPDKPYFGESDDPNFTQLAGSSKGFFYTEFAKTKQAQDIRERHLDDVSSDPNNPFQGTMFNPGFQREFKQAFEEFMKPYLEKSGGNWGQAVEYYTTIVDNNKGPINIH